MKLLDFKKGKFFIKHYDLLMHYERFMPVQAKQNAIISAEMKQQQKVLYETMKQQKSGQSDHLKAAIDKLQNKTLSKDLACVNNPT